MGYRTRQGQAFAPMTVWRLARLNAEPVIPAPPPIPATPAMQTTLTLWLRVENNNKFVRGKKRAHEDIQRYCLSAYQMKKLRDGQYELTFTYRDDADLDKQVYSLLDEIESQADFRNCFTEADMRQPGTERDW